MTYPVPHSVDCAGQFINDVAEEADQDNQGNDEHKESNAKVENLPPNVWPVCKICDTLQVLEGGFPDWSHFHGENCHTREGWNQSHEPGGCEEFVRRSWDYEGPGDGTVPVQGYGHQHVVGRGEGVSLEKLK